MCVSGLFFSLPFTCDRNGQFVWNLPETEEFRAVQGYMMYPVDGGKETVYISVSLRVEKQNDCSRPAGTITASVSLISLQMNLLKKNIVACELKLQTSSNMLNGSWCDTTF
jgi:hypothetical protein